MKKQINIKKLDGTTYTFIVKETITIYDLKLLLQKKVGADPECQNLIFQGQFLEDNELLYKYKIENDSTIHLIFKLREIK